ncbi:MAG TPA: hypothetical protein VGQ30_05440 [Gemmatimonadaceae bacterium]|nr:hypothetical protein [Gemmatimonadaceae bacterium]
MPFHFEFDKKNKILLIVVEGDYGDDEQVIINGRIREKCKELGAVAGIGDMSGVTAFNVSLGVLQNAAKAPAPYDVGVPRYLVAPADHTFGMSRMYQLAADKTRAGLKVVRSREEALADLGVRNASFERVSELAEAL